MLEVSRYWDRPYCLYRLPILRLWVNAIAQHLDYTRCNTQNCWRSVDAHFQTGAGTMSQSVLRITAANMLILSISRTGALELYKMQHSKSLTLCWHSVDAVLMLWWCSVDALLILCWCSFWGVAVSAHTILPINAASTSIMGKCRSTSLGLYMMQHTKLLMLCWRSSSDWGCDHVTITFAHHSCKSVDYGYLS
jgi:hypothetical protein